jgi:hypothetical protein
MSDTPSRSVQRRDAANVARLQLANLLAVFVGHHLAPPDARVIEADGVAEVRA